MREPGGPEPDMCTFHEALPVAAGALPKWVVQLWLTELPVRTRCAPPAAIVALHRRSSTSCQIHKQIRCLYF